MNKETLTNTEAVKLVDSIDWLDEFRKLDSFDIVDLDYGWYEMQHTPDGKYLRREDVMNIVRMCIKSNQTKKCIS